MAKGQWGDEAIRWAAGIVRNNPDALRGVAPTDEHGVSVVFAPLKEIEAVKTKLKGAGIEVLGQGNSLAAWGGMLSAVLVKSADVEALNALVNG